jgi:hypothetical protein
VIPIALEMIILIIVGIFVQSSLSSSEGKWIAFMLFAMGIKLFGNQNFSIYRKNNPFNRAFTDLGIELNCSL